MLIKLNNIIFTQKLLIKTLSLLLLNLLILGYLWLFGILMSDEYVNYFRYALGDSNQKIIFFILGSPLYILIHLLPLTLMLGVIYGIIGLYKIQAVSHKILCFISISINSLIILLAIAFLIDVSSTWS
jgi:hypothetical protein